MKKFMLGFGFMILSFSGQHCYAGDEISGQGFGGGQGYVPPAITSTPSPAPSTPSSPSSPAAPAAEEVPATAGSAGYYQVKLQEPLSGQSAYVSAYNGVDLINQYISMIYMWMASIVGILAVLMIVVSGIQIIFGGASPEMVSDAKNRVTQSLLSLVLLFATAMILRTVNPNFFGFM